MLDQKKKCIAKKCEDCRLYVSFDMTSERGVRKQVYKCILEVLAQEIPNINGSIDGLQEGVNDSRNRSLELKGIVEKRTEQFVGSIKLIADHAKRIGHERSV